MTGSTVNIRSMSRRRRIATVVAVAGAAFVANHLREIWPREVRVAYEVGPDVGELAVDYVQDRDAIVSVRFRRPDEKPPVFWHTVRLQPGTYQVHITLYGPEASAIEEVRELRVPVSASVRYELQDATHRFE
jgi:hypothetical protein